MDAVLEEEFEINHISYIPSPRLAQSASELVTGVIRYHHEVG
jgi:c-di-AMP phosphodiesterase-like protein